VQQPVAVAQTRVVLAAHRDSGLVVPFEEPSLLELEQEGVSLGAVL
jgi:hypothetical protein